jgi:diguanylate cyclase (GGDEF)-like protein/PAS domain S-box-containing protein
MVLNDAPRRRAVSAAARAGAPPRGALAGLEAVARHAWDGVVIWDADLRIVYASPYLERLAGVAPGGLVGRRGVSRMHPDDYAAHKPRIEEILARPGASVRYEARIADARGEWVWNEITTTNLYDDPAVRGLVANVRDVSARRTADAQREAVATLGSRALAGWPLGRLAQEAVRIVVELLRADTAAVLEHVQPGDETAVVRACVGWPIDATGYQLPAPPGSPTARVLAEGRAVVVADYREEEAFPTKSEVDASGLRASIGVPIAGRDRPWGVLGVLSAQPHRFSATDADFVQAVANVLASTIERDRAQAELLRHALQDPLTGLANRALLVDRVDHVLATLRRARGDTVVVLFVDVDRFKRVNDTLGHEVGDELLRQLAGRLRSVVREEDTVARFGGDEFVVAVRRRRGEKEQIVVLAERILAAIRDPFSIDDRTLHVTASVGIAATDDAGDNAERLLRDADAAMYEAKAAGRDRYEVFDQELRVHLVHRLDVEAELRAAVRDGALRVWYQPVVDTSSGFVAGFEALLRWAHPTRGTVYPADFVPIAEETGLICPIGELVLREACEQVARWQLALADPTLGVSVNVSPRQLADPAFPAQVEAALTATGLRAGALQLEITETMIVEDLARAAHVLDAIAALGVGIVVDDFGTGYSSLSHLKQLPVHCVKIDRSFVVDVARDPVDRAIVAAVVELTRQLGACAVAEGVETTEQLLALHDLGCTLVQGFVHAPALPAHEVEAWLRSRRAR